MANSSDSEEIREMGLTTPDKPVAKRSSTVPVQGRIAKKRTNEHGACLASHRSTLLRMPLFVLLTPILRCPFPTLPSFMSLPCTPARPRALIRVTVQNPRNLPIVKKKRSWQICIGDFNCYSQYNIYKSHHLNHIFSLYEILFLGNSAEFGAKKKS